MEKLSFKEKCIDAYKNYEDLEQKKIDKRFRDYLSEKIISLRKSFKEIFGEDLDVVENKIEHERYGPQSTTFSLWVEFEGITLAYHHENGTCRGDDFYYMHKCECGELIRDRRPIVSKIDLGKVLSEGYTFHPDKCPECKRKESMRINIREGEKKRSAGERFILSINDLLEENGYGGLF